VTTDTARALLAEAESLRARLRGPNSDDVMARFEEIYSEFQEAFELLLAERARDDGARLASALVPFWMATKRLEDGERWLERATAMGTSPSGATARARMNHGYLIFWSGAYDRSAELSSRAVADAREVGDATVEALALTVLARIALNTDLDEAKRLLREAVAVTDGTDDVEGRSSAMHVLGVAHQMSGELDEARQVMSDRIALGRSTGNDFVIAIESANLSMVERQLGHPEDADALAIESLATFHRLGDHLAASWAANSVAATAAALGRLERAATMLGFAEAGIERAGGEWPPDERQQREGTIATLEAGLQPGALEAARSAGRAMGTEEGVAFATSAEAGSRSA
jgi:tetratricopeptide (TPR) repeat protein